MRYTDQHGQNITLGRKLGAGGEGAVYEVADIADLVAKIYHQPVTPEKAAKLAAMAQLATAEILKFAAWPKATLHQRPGSSAVGIILPRIKKSHEVHELYSPAHRKSHFPHADWRFLIRAARNCAAAVANLHNHQIVIGDVNQGNVFVSEQATVTLIDCDSFQVAANGRLYRCLVGVPHFVPPELQHVRLSDVIRTFNHDNFGLAVLVFHLLFMGRHPFAGRYSGRGDMPIENAIREYRFAYSSSAARLQMAPPPNSLTLGALPDGVGLLFERAFSNGSELAHARPTAQVWAQTLERLERSLCQCRDDAGHFYATHLRDCPWCDVIRAGGPNFFISVTIQAIVARSQSFDLAKLWAQIQSVPRPDQNYRPAARVATKHIRPRPIPSASDENRTIRNAVGTISASAGAVTVLAFLFSAVAVFSIPMCVVFAIWWLLLKVNSPLGQLKRERREIHRSKVHELERAQANQRAVAQRFLQQFQVKLDTLQRLKRTYEQLKTLRESELHSLHHQVQQRQLEQHLRGCFISNAHINGIGPGRISALESYGIETAYDIEDSRVLSVPGFGEKMTERLLSWRGQREREFRFNPSQGVPQTDIQALEMKYAQKRSQCERAFQHGPHELGLISNAAKAEVERLDSVVARLEGEAAQTKADVRVFDRIPWWY